MKRIFFSFLFFPQILFTIVLNAQDSKDNLINTIFQGRGEIYFKFKVFHRDEVQTLTKIISIDNINDHEVYAYANRKEFSDFLDFNYTYTILPPPSSLLKESELNMGGITRDLMGRTLWNFYPTYQQYLDFMSGFASSYPDICKLDTIGTSIQGRLLLAVKISDSVDLEQGEPQVFYTSSIHGDETAGYVLMLHLIDYLLFNYGTDPRITGMINNNEIYINPLANPDGTYHGGNNSVGGAQRYNASNIDLNRNFPDPADGPHPDQNPWQQETMAFMEYADSTHFVMSMNFHGGVEVLNYPWDTWARLHADDLWWRFVGREYADTVHKYGPSGYFTYLDNGITNGYAWYRITGGRQDYTSYFHYGREATLEISNVKLLPANQLLNLWNYNYHSFLNYIDQASFGINGRVTDTLTGQSLKAMVFITGHDFDNSWVYSKLPSGRYFRPINQGSYNLVFSAPGYFTKTINGVSVSKWNMTPLNVKLVPLNIGMSDIVIRDKPFIFPNPAWGQCNIILPETSISSFSMEVFNMTGQSVYREDFKAGGSLTIPVDLGNLPGGLYLIRLNSGNSIFENRIIRY